MTSTPSKGKFVLTLNYAPSDANYGKFVEEGTQYMEARPFAEKASQDPLLKKTIDAYVNGYMEKDFLPVIKIGLDRAFRSLSAERAKAR
jgi:hypothetical protein